MMGGAAAYNVFLAVVEPFCLESFFLSLSGFEFFCNVGIDEVCNVLAIHDLRDSVILPLIVCQQVILCVSPCQSE